MALPLSEGLGSTGDLADAYALANQTRTATPSKPTQPGCLPLVPISTKAELASMARKIACKRGTVSWNLARASKTRIPARHQPSTVRTCQLAHRMRTCPSPMTRPPFVGMRPRSRMRRKIKTSPRIECARPTKKASTAAAISSRFIGLAWVCLYCATVAPRAERGIAASWQFGLGRLGR